jgi:hypothetical protein
MTAAPHCHELSRQSPSSLTTTRVCACAGAPAYMGINGNCRVSARQCAAAIPPRGLPPVGHDVGRGFGLPDGSGRCPTVALAAHGATSPNRAGRGGWWVRGVSRYGVGTSRSGTGPRRQREQPPLSTESVSRVRARDGDVAAASASRGAATTWANVGEPVANGRGRERATRRQSDADPTANRRVRPRVRRGMNRIEIAARSKA